MKIGFLKDNESRVSLTPIILSKYEKLGYKICLESGAGSLAGYPDKAYECTKLTKNNLIKESDVIVCVDSSAIGDLNKLNNKIVITNFSGHTNIEKKINGKTILFDLSKIPRTTIAQSMDILSSMSGLSGYKSIIKAAELLSLIHI